MNTVFPRTVTLPCGYNYKMFEPHQRMQNDEELQNLTIDTDLDLDCEDYPDNVWSVFDMAILFQVTDVPKLGLDDIIFIYKDIFGKEPKVIGERKW